MLKDLSKVSFLKKREREKVEGKLSLAV